MIYLLIIFVVGAMIYRMPNTAFFLAISTKWASYIFEAVRDLTSLNIKLLLFGNDTLNNAINATLFRAVHAYINNTLWFDNTWAYIFSLNQPV